jgi:very-short-patch-repair endonuclease
MDALPICSTNFPSPACGRRWPEGPDEGLLRSLKIQKFDMTTKTTDTNQLGRARALRKRSTPIEIEVWSVVRNRAFHGFKFRRQFSVGTYICDFVCLEKSLVVELDGSQHADQIAYDTMRDLYLREQGFQVYRIWNHDWTHRRTGVLESLYRALFESNASPSPVAARHPLPGGRGEQNSPRKSEGKQQL